MNTYDTIARAAVLFIIMIVLACPICTAIVANSKGRDTAGWFLLGAVFGPFGLLAAIGVTSRVPIMVEIVDFED